MMSPFVVVVGRGHEVAVPTPGPGRDGYREGTDISRVLGKSACPGGTGQNSAVDEYPVGLPVVSHLNTMAGCSWNARRITEDGTCSRLGMAL
ncbi:Hypothetical protein AA314_01070 [Archangium gephyra]|uniref:Uncharacterized protein n=1 Tax=Archangium gephyra TaxID=48 RepID=A0AAC8Q1X3_9BACT|nr:Hypothetical protein AA314_01070 [Archangium gephyra]